MLSIVIPTYNRAGNLRLCLASLMRQDDAGFSVVVADDGSTDDTRRIVELFQSRWNRIAVTYVHCGPNQGVRTGRARNIGAANIAPESTHILMFDSDLVVPPDYVAQMRRQVTGFRGVVLGRVEWLSPTPHELLARWVEAGEWSRIASRVPQGVPHKIDGTYTGRELRRDIPGIPPGAWKEAAVPLSYQSSLALPLNSCYPRNLFWQAGGFDESITGYGYQDMLFGLAISKLSPPCRAAGEALAYHVWHPKPAPDLYHAQAQCNLDTLIRLHGPPWSYGDQVDWTFWWHYGADRGGSAERSADGSLWVINHDRTWRLAIDGDPAAWLTRLALTPGKSSEDLERIRSAGSAQETALDAVVLARKLLHPAPGSGLGD